MSGWTPTGEGFFSGNPTHVGDKYWNADAGVSYTEYVEEARRIARAQGVDDSRDAQGHYSQATKAFQTELEKIEKIGIAREDVLKEYFERKAGGEVDAAVEEAEDESDEAAAAEKARLEAGFGRHKSVLFGRRGLTAPVPTRRKSLLGVGG